MKQKGKRRSRWLCGLLMAIAMLSLGGSNSFAASAMAAAQQTDDELPNFIDGDSLYIEGVQQIRDRIAQINMGSVKVPDEITTLYQKTFTFKIKRPKGAQANYPVSICVKTQNPEIYSEYFIISKIGDEVVSSVKYSDEYECWGVEKSLYNNWWKKITFAAGETEKTFEMSFYRYPDDYMDANSSYFYQYLVFDYPEHTGIDYDCLVLKVKNENYVRPASGSDDDASFIQRSVYAFNAEGKYIISSTYINGHMLEVDEDTRLELHKFVNTHENHEKSGQDFVTQKDSVTYLKPIEEVGEETKYYTLITKVEDSDVAMDYYAWGNRIHNDTYYKLSNWKFAGSDELLDYSRNMSCEGYDMEIGATGAVVRPHFGALSFSKSKYNKGERAVLSAKLLNAKTMNEFYVNNSWLKALDITLDGGETMLGTTPTYDEETQSVVFTFLAPDTRSDGKYLAEIMMKGELVPWPSEMYDMGFEFYEDPNEEYVSLDHLLAGNAYAWLNVSSSSASNVYTESIAVTGLPDANTIFLQIPETQWSYEEAYPTYNLSANITPQNATFGGKWTSSNTDVITITDDGVLKAIDAGTAEISFVSDEVAYRADNSMSAKDDVLKWSTTVTVIGEDDFPKITSCTPNQNKQDADPYYCLVVNSSDWKICGDAKVRIEHMATDDMNCYVTYSTEEVFTPSEGLIRRKIPFSDSFPFKRSDFAYEIKISVPMKNSQGLVYNATCEQKFYVTNDHSMEITGVENVNVTTQDDETDVATDFEIHYINPDNKLYLYIKNSDIQYGNDYFGWHSNTYIYTTYSMDIDYAINGSDKDYAPLPSWITVTTDDKDSDFWMAKVHVSDKLKAGHSYQVKVIAKEGDYSSVGYNANAIYNILKPNLDDSELGYYRDADGTHSLNDWVEDNSAEWKEVADLLKAGDSYGAIKKKNVLTDYTKTLSLTYPNTWGKCMLAYDNGEQTDVTGDVDEVGLNVNVYREITFPQDGVQHTVSFIFPGIGLQKDFKFTNNPIPDELCNYYDVVCYAKNNACADVSNLKGTYTVRRYDEANDTTILDTFYVTIPLTEDMQAASSFKFTMQTEGLINSITFDNADSPGALFAEKAFVGGELKFTPLMKGTNGATNYVELNSRLFSQLTIIDEATGEPITDASVRYCHPTSWYASTSYIVDLYNDGGNWTGTATGSFDNEGDGVYTLRLDKEEMSGYASNYTFVEITKDGYMTLMMDLGHNSYLTSEGYYNSDTYYKLLADNTDKTVVLKRINNTCVLPYLAVGSESNTTDYPIEYSNPQLNSIIRFNEEDSPALYCIIPTDEIFYKNESGTYITPSMELEADNENYYLVGNSTRRWDSYYQRYIYWPTYRYDRSDASHVQRADLSKDKTGFTQSYKLYRFDLTGFIPGQKKDSGEELIKSTAWITETASGKKYELPYLMNTSIDASEYAKDVDITIPDTDVKSRMGETTNSSSVNTGFMSKAFKNFEIPIQGVLPFDITLKRENDYFIMRGTYSQSFLPDAGVSEKLQHLADAEEFFYSLKDAITGKTGSYNRDQSWFAMPSAFVGFRAYVEGRAGINPLTQTVDAGISGLGAKAEASGYFRAGFKTPLGSLGFSLSGELSAYLNLESAQPDALVEAGLDPRLTCVYDISIGSIVDFRVSLFGDLGIDLGLIGAGVGFYGTAGCNFEARDTFKPYYKDVNKAVNGGIRFGVDASLEMYWWVKFLFYKKKHTWTIFDFEKKYYFPKDESNPLYVEDKEEEEAVKSQSYLRSSVYKRYSRKRIPHGAKVLLRKIDSEAMPFYLNGGQSLAYLDINTASDPNDDKVKVMTDGNNVTLDGDGYDDKANFSLNASSAGSKSVVSYERSTAALDVDATEGNNEVLNMMNVASSSEIVAATNTSGTWTSTTLSEADGTNGNFGPKSAINESGKAVVVWKNGVPRFDEDGEMSGITGNILLRTVGGATGTDTIRTVIANNEKNSITDYNVGISKRGKPVVFCSVRKDSLNSYLCAINNEGFKSILSTNGQMLNILPINDTTFVASALSSYKENVTTNQDTVAKYKEVSDVQLFKISDEGNIQSIGFLGLSGHNPTNVKLVGTGSTHTIDGLGVIWEEVQKDEETGITASVMYGARVGYSDNKVYASCPKELYKLTDDVDYISYFDGYMNDSENKLVAAITVADRETDGSVVYEEDAAFENKFAVYDADAQKVVNDGQSSIVVSVANEGYRPIDYVSVDINGNETTVPVSIMPGCTENVTGYAAEEADLNSDLSLNVNASFSENISYARSREGSRRARASMNKVTASTSLLSLAAADMDVELISSSTNEDLSTNALINVVNKSKIRLKDDYIVTVGVYKDITGEEKLSGVDEITYKGKNFYTRSGGLIPQMAVFHIPAQTTMCNLFAIVKVTDSEGNEIKELTPYDNKLPITIYAQKTASDLLGDANSDGSVDSKDAVLIVSEYVGTNTNDINRTNADANEDGTIDAKDAMWVVQSYVNNYSSAVKARSPRCARKIAIR